MAVHFGVLVSRPQQVRRGISVLAGVMDPDQLEEVGQGDYMWNPDDPFGHLLVLLCPTVTVNRLMQQCQHENNMIAKTFQELRFESHHL